jgi:hypothetical protein
MKFVVALCGISLLPLCAETLHYSINWPSGLSLGEAEISSVAPTSASGQETPWSFKASIDASLPGYALRDHYSSSATPAFCSLNLTKEFEHGSRKGQEKETFHADSNTVTRETRPGGGKSDISVSACARDALTFLAFLRHELAQGRLAPQQAVVFGALYQVRAEFTGTQEIKVSDHKMDADRMQVTFKGPASDFTFEMFFSKDAARTPVFARLPLPLGAFTVELIH